MNARTAVCLVLPLLLACKRDAVPLEAVGEREPPPGETSLPEEPAAEAVRETEPPDAEQEQAQDPPSTEVEPAVVDSPPAAEPPREQEIPANLRCKRDDDCVVMPPEPCSCPPCGDVWRGVLNRKAFAAWEQRWATRRCKRPVCEECEGRYLGTKATCEAGLCTIDRTMP